MSASNCKSTYQSFCSKGSKQSCEKKQDELEDEMTDTSVNVETVNNDDKSKQNQLSKRKHKKVNKM